jgi:hypothetical protein
MYERRGVERVTGTLTVHLAVGHPLQFLIDEREQAIEGPRVPSRERLQERRHVRV